MLQAVGDFLVTNIWTKDISVPVAVLRYRQGLIRKRCRGDAAVLEERSGSSGRYAIRPNAMTRVRMHFTVPNTSREERKPLVADVIRLDQFNNEHLVEGLVFTCRCRSGSHVQSTGRRSSRRAESPLLHRRGPLRRRGGGRPLRRRRRFPPR
jgi:hypothetical protein